MSSLTTRSTLKIAALTLSLAASAFGATAAHAAGPRLLASEVAGAYDMQDGSTLRIEVIGSRVLVESSAQEYWTPTSTNVLVSPDGQRRIKLMRDYGGKVERIEMEIRQAR